MESTRSKRQPSTGVSATPAYKRKAVVPASSSAAKRLKKAPSSSEKTGLKRKPQSKSAAIPKAPQRRDPSALIPLANSARTVLRKAHALVSVMQGELWLLSQIHYRDHGPMRTSKFYQSAEGLLRALRRTLGDDHPSPASVKRARRESRRRTVSSRGKGGSKARFPPIAPELMSEPAPLPPLGPCALRDALRHGTRAVIAMYPPGRKRGTNPLVPPKMSGAPNTPPPAEVARIACLSILQTAVQLVALLDRCQGTYRTLTLHLRTGPAPTFVPSVVSMLAVAARTHMASREILFGKAQPVPVRGGTSDQGLLELYALLVPFAGGAGDRLDLYALVCALRGEPTLSSAAVDRFSALLSNGEGELPKSLGIETQALSIGGVPWLSDLRVPVPTSSAGLPSALPSKVNDLLPVSAAVPRPADPMHLDDDLGEVVEG